MPIISGAKSVTVNKMTPLTPEVFREWMRLPIVGKVYAAIRQLNEDLAGGKLTQEVFDKQKAAQKRLLPVVCYMASFNGTGIRQNSNATPTDLLLMDYDHLPDPQAFYTRHVKGREAELHLCLAHITPSGHGLRLVACLLPGESITQGQKRLHASLGCPEPFDACVKDPARA